ncbi:MAG: hypothetical protein JW982_03175 [Spirochaetes bacterium]|nr:hypothetical protein [Spirochaetota bacterium]
MTERPVPDLNTFTGSITRNAILPLKTIHMSQIILIMPYSLMFWLLLKDQTGTENYPELMALISLIYSVLYVLFFSACRLLYKRQLKKCSPVLFEKIKKQFPEHAEKTDEQLYILQIQKATNIFYAFLDAYSLAGMILLIVLIKNGTDMSSMRAWINAVPMVCTILHAAITYPDADKLIKIFKKYIMRQV